jgi:methyl-accepting chemotaxis protein
MTNDHQRGPVRLGIPAPVSLELPISAEDAEKDEVTFRAGARRRLLSTAVIGTAALVGAASGFISASATTVLAIIAAVLVANAVLAAMAKRLRGSSWRFRYGFAVLDVSMITLVVATLGWPGLVSLYFLVIVPYSFDRGRELGYFTALLSAAGYVAGSMYYRSVHRDAAVLTEFGWILASAALILMVSLQVVPIASRIIRRIRQTRECMAEAERGNLMVRADARYADELGFLQRSFNRMMQQLGELIATVQRGADEVAALAEGVSRSTEEVNRASAQFADAARVLREQLNDQLAFAATGTRQTAEAQSSSERLRDRAEEMETEVGDLQRSAGSSRDAMERATETLVTLGQRVSTTAATARRLRSASESVGEFVTTIGRIARQTNLLALNAAIEAARAGEQGKGFNVVADEVRKLADESARAAKAIAETITGVRESIDGVLREMAAGEEEVRDVGEIAEKASRSLGDTFSEVARISEVIVEAASVSRAQGDAMSALSEAITRAERSAGEAAGRAIATADRATQQAKSVEDLTNASRRLAILSEELRASTSRFESRHQHAFAVDTGERGAARAVAIAGR